jgi:hypothetical protein
MFYIIIHRHNHGRLESMSVIISSAHNITLTRNMKARCLLQLQIITIITNYFTFLFWLHK